MEMTASNNEQNVNQKKENESAQVELSKSGRNFRSSYYEKVGFRGFDEKKSLELILNEKPFNLIKLEQFVLKYSIPQVYREKVWLLLLGLVSSDSELDEFILEEQSVMCNDLLRPLVTLGLVNEESSNAKKLTLMYLLDSGLLSPFSCDQADNARGRDLLAIARTFCQVIPPFSNTYWLFKHFLKKMELSNIDLESCVGEVKSELAMKCPLVEKHLHKIGAYDQLPLKLWSSRCFSAVIETEFLVKIWDKVVAGGYQQVFPLVCKFILLNLSNDLLNQDSTTIGNYFQSIKVDKMDMSLLGLNEEKNGKI